MNRWYIILTSIFVLMSLTSCDEVAEDYKYTFYNDSVDTVYVYDCRFRDNTDTIKTSSVIAHYSILERIEPHRMTNLFISGVSLYTFGATGVSQIMVFRQRTLENHTLKEIADSNIYDALYIFPWTEMVAPGFEIRYDGESHWLEIQNPKRPN